MFTSSQLKTVIKDKIDLHERSIPMLGTFNDREQIRIKIAAFNEILDIIE